MILLFVALICILLHKGLLRSFCSRNYKRQDVPTLDLVLFCLAARAVTDIFEEKL